MDKEQIKEKLIYIVKTGVSDWYTGPITEETTMTDMACDSLDAIELQVLIEKAFRISPSENEWASTSTIGDWINLVQKHVNK